MAQQGMTSTADLKSCVGFDCKRSENVELGKNADTEKAVECRFFEWLDKKWNINMAKKNDVWEEYGQKKTHLGDSEFIAVGRDRHNSTTAPEGSAKIKPNTNKS